MNVVYIQKTINTNSDVILKQTYKKISNKNKKLDSIRLIVCIHTPYTCNNITHVFNFFYNGMNGKVRKYLYDVFLRLILCTKTKEIFSLLCQV